MQRCQPVTPCRAVSCHGEALAHPADLVFATSVQCIAQGATTTVVILGSGRDPGVRTQKTGVEILDDLKAALRLAPIEL